MIGSVEPMKQLYAAWGERVDFVDVIIRQGHPGPAHPPYRDWQKKQSDAEAYKRDERIPWRVLIDDLEGTVHRRYGMLADPTYVIDTEGRVAFYNMVTHAPTLHHALTRLMGQGGSGVVLDGVDKTPHVLAMLTDGWRGIRRGLAQSFWDLERAAPGSAIGPWVGYQLKPVLAPFTLRGRPLPRSARVLLLGAVAGAAAWWLAARRSTRTERHPPRRIDLLAGALERRGVRAGF